MLLTAPPKNKTIQLTALSSLFGIFDEDDVEAEPPGHQFLLLLSETSCPICTVCLKVPLTSAGAKLKYSKSDEKKSKTRK